MIFNLTSFTVFAVFELFSFAVFEKKIEGIPSSGLCLHTPVLARQEFHTGPLSSVWTMSGSAKFFCCFRSSQTQTLAWRGTRVPLWQYWRSTLNLGDRVKRLLMLLSTPIVFRLYILLIDLRTLIVRRLGAGCGPLSPCGCRACQWTVTAALPGGRQAASVGAAAAQAQAAQRHPKQWLGACRLSPSLAGPCPDQSAGSRRARRPGSPARVIVARFCTAASESQASARACLRRSLQAVLSELLMRRRSFKCYDAAAASLGGRRTF